MSLSRRQFLTQSATAVALTAGLSLTRPGTAAGLPASSRTLVILELNGGNDALNTVIPIADPHYAMARPTLAIAPEQALPLGRGIALHPAMGALHRLYGQGKLALVMGTGYPNPSRSHFRSLEVYHRGGLSTSAGVGWLARCAPAVPAAHFGADCPELFAGSRSILSIPSGDDAASPAHQPPALQAQRWPKAAYGPDRLSAAFATCAQLIVENAGPRLFHITQGGFDTHARQAEGHAALLRQVSGALSSFLADLAAEGRDREVLVMVFSEFGRRVRENGSAGTDHGAAGVMLFAGGAVKGGLYGQYPRLSELSEGDLPHTVDFRDCYATVQRRWLGTTPLTAGSRSDLTFV